MIAFVAGLFVVPMLDQAVKILVLCRLEPASVTLGPLGRLQVVRSQIWLVRHPFQPKLVATWCMWLAAAGSLCVLTSFFPSCGGFAGALVGGSLSHVLETTVRGCVVDYIRLRFWPAFNFADVTITVGAVGILAQVVQMG